MLEVTLIYPTPEGSKEIAIDGEKTSFGRGSEAVHRFSDDGLSRLHATVYRDGDRVWIVDENSSNGTFVNGVKTAPAGTPLRDGDAIKIGHQTTLKVRASEKAAERPVQKTAPPASPGPKGTSPIAMIAIGIIAVTILIVSVSAVLIGFKILGSSRASLESDEPKSDPIEISAKKSVRDDPSPSSSSKPVYSGVSENTSATELPLAADAPAPAATPSSKKYSEMSDTERRQYLGDKAMRIAQIIGNRSSDAIPPAAIDKIKGFTDAYASRARVKPLGGCRFGDNLQATFERASKNAPFIVKAFNEKGIDPRIGLYLAMIESEHCVCLQSPTGPLGMFNSRERPRRSTASRSLRAHRRRIRTSAANPHRRRVRPHRI